MGVPKLEYKIIGNGKITLVIDIGIGNSFYNWYSFAEMIDEDFKVVLYHRAGYGKSSVPEKLRTTQNIAEELDELLSSIGIPGKFLLMGHSFGGLCAQQYTKMFPEKLIGLILVDSTSYNFNRLYELDIPVMSSLMSLEKMIESNRDTSRKTKEELEATFAEMIAAYQKKLPEAEHKQFADFITNPQLFKTIADEFESWHTSSESIKKMGDFPDIPLKVIARDKQLSAQPFVEHGIPEKEAILYEETWRGLQKELAAQSNKGELIIADKSDHEIHIDRPDVIIDCLKEFHHAYVGGFL